MKLKHTPQQYLMNMATASVRRFGEFIGLNRPIIIKFSNSKNYYGKYETELIVADTVEIAHIITLSAAYNTYQEVTDSSMAHEMVHALQIEQGMEADHSGIFPEMREKIMAVFGVDIDEEF